MSKIILSLYACAIIFCASAAIVDEPPNYGQTIGGTIYELNLWCDYELTSGIQCTVTTPVGIKPVYRIGSPSTPLYRIP